MVKSQKVLLRGVRNENHVANPQSLNKCSNQLHSVFYYYGCIFPTDSFHNKNSWAGGLRALDSQFLGDRFLFSVGFRLWVGSGQMDW
jgi:hypothetical protein